MDTKRSIKRISLPAIGSAALCLLSAGVLASSAPTQDQGGKQQGGQQGGQGGGQATPESMPAKQRQQPAGQEGGDLATELGRLQNEFNERLRTALRGTDATKHGKPIADELMVTMFGSDRIVAGYPVEGSTSTGSTGAGAGGAAAGREGAGGASGGTGATGGGGTGASGTGGSGGQTPREGDTGADNKPANAPSMKGGGEVLGVLVVAAPRPSDSKPANQPVDAGAGRGGASGMDQKELTAGIYEVRLVEGNTLAIVNEAGTPIHRIPFHGDPMMKKAGSATPGGTGATGGGAAGREGGSTGGTGGNEGSGEIQGGKPGADQGNPGSRGAPPTPVNAHAGRPDWSKVYLAVVSDIAPTFGQGMTR